MIKCLITAHTSWYSPKGVRYCRISLCCMPRVRGEREKDIGTMWYPPLGAQITFPVERKPLLVLINNGCFACRQLLPETNIKETELACARQIYLEYFLHGTPPPHPFLLTPSPSLRHKRRETNDNKQKYWSAWGRTLLNPCYCDHLDILSNPSSSKLKANLVSLKLPEVINM